MTSPMLPEHNQKQVPLRELLLGVPADAVLRINTPNAIGDVDTRSIPVGRFCHEAAAALANPSVNPTGNAYGGPRDEGSAGGEAVAPFHADLRQSMGEALTSKLLDGAESPDWNDSREVDRIIDCVQGCIEVWQEENAERRASAGAAAPTVGQAAEAFVDGSGKVRNVSLSPGSGHLGVCPEDQAKGCRIVPCRIVLAAAPGSLQSSPKEEAR